MYNPTYSKSVRLAQKYFVINVFLKFIPITVVKNMNFNFIQTFSCARICVCHIITGLYFISHYNVQQRTCIFFQRLIPVLICFDYMILCVQCT